MNPPLSKDRAQRMSRNLLVTEWSHAAQTRLESLRTLVVGCGGLASFVLPQLVAAGLQRITLVDDDVVELSNLNRQVLHREADLGRPKVDSAREALLALDSGLTIEAFQERVTTENATHLAVEHDLILDCADGLPTKYLLNDVAVANDVFLVHGAVTSLAGQVMTIRGAEGPCLRCMFPEIPPAGTVPTCQQAGVLAPAVGLVGSLMAMEVLRLAGLEPKAEPGRWLVVDASGPHVQTMRLARAAQCRACSLEADLDGIDPSEYVMARGALGS